MDGDAIQVEGDEATVGRREGCEVFIPDKSVSRGHARLERRSDGWYVVDLGSANGTFLGGQRIEAAKLDGSELCFGDVRFRVELRDETTLAATVQLGVPRNLRFDEPKPSRRPPAPPAPVAGESPTIRAQPGAVLAMTKEAARGLLGLPPGASVAEGRRRYEQMFNDYHVRVTNAPTATLRRMYQRNLNELRGAFEALFPGQPLP